MSTDFYMQVSMTCRSGTISASIPRGEGKKLAEAALSLQRKANSRKLAKDLVNLQTASYLADKTSNSDDDGETGGTFFRDGILIISLTIFIGLPDHVDEILKALGEGNNIKMIVMDEYANITMKGQSSSKTIRLKMKSDFMDKLH